jgi:hypothetical protein
MKTNKILLKTMAFAFLGSALIACGDDDPVSLPPIGGYNSADEVGAADLVAYWPLNGSGVESMSSTAPTNTVGASYADAVKGQGVVLSDGYLAYPEIAALSTTTGNMSVSFWAKVTNNGGPDGVNPRPTMLFSMSRPNEWAGNFNFFAETGGRAATNDTLLMKGLVVIKNTDGGANFQDIINSPNPSVEDLANGHVGNPCKNGGQWAHYVATWEASSGMFRLYANGQKISNPAYEVRNGGSALPLNFFTPTKAIIGTFQTVIDGNPDAWQTPANASMDEVRVWKKTLNAADVNSLYELELAGR